MKKPKISIIIPFFNTEKQLFTRCMNSVFCQTFKDFEIIIVDDGSDEKYKNVLKELLDKDSRIRIISKNNEGVSLARNTGVKEAIGDYITFIDSDDEVLPYFLEEAIGVITEQDADFVIGGLHYIENDGKTVEYNTGVKNTIIINDINKNSIIPNLLYNNDYFDNGGNIGRGPVSRLLKREIANKIEFDSNLVLGEDVVWNLEIVRVCKKICVVKKVWYLYYRNESSATNKYNDQIIIQMDKQLFAIKELIDLRNDKIYVSYCRRVLEEMRKVFFNYLYRKEFKESYKRKKTIYNHLYKGKPWNVLRERRAKILVKGKDAIRIKCYNLKILFFIMRLSQKMHKFFG